MQVSKLYFREFYFDHSITKINSLKPEKNAKESKSRAAPLPCLGYEANAYLSSHTLEKKQYF